MVQTDILVSREAFERAPGAFTILESVVSVVQAMIEADIEDDISRDARLANEFNNYSAQISNGGPNEDRDLLQGLDDELFEINARIPHDELAEAWLRAHPALTVLPLEELRAEIDRRVREVADSLP